LFYVLAPIAMILGGWPAVLLAGSAVIATAVALLAYRRLRCALSKLE
jgi:hypothetical protein